LLKEEVEKEKQKEMDKEEEKKDEEEEDYWSPICPHFQGNTIITEILAY